MNMQVLALGVFLSSLGSVLSSLRSTLGITSLDRLIGIIPVSLDRLRLGGNESRATLDSLSRAIPVPKTGL